MRIGFIGFGEVASTFARAMQEHGAAVAAYDLLFAHPEGRRMLAARAQDLPINFGPLPDVVGGADYVLSTVTTQAAREAAAACAQHLRPGQVFLDLNSTSPAAKQELARLIGPSGADFVEGAILGAVGATGAATEILTGGPKAAEAAAALSALGLRARYYSPEIGKASMFKMLRSIFSKGLEAVLVEFLIAARRAGMAEDLWRDVAEFMTHNRFEAVASNWVRTHAVAHSRRHHEMVQVLETMQELGVKPVVSEAVKALFERSASLGLEQAFPEKPGSMEEVIEHMEQRLRQILSTRS